MDILDRLYKYCGEDYVPMHMPGAKRNTKLFEMGNPYGLDITEITGFDNMHHADGIIKEAFERAAGVFGADAISSLGCPIRCMGVASTPRCALAR